MAGHEQDSFMVVRDSGLAEAIAASEEQGPGLEEQFPSARQDHGDGFFVPEPVAEG